MSHFKPALSGFAVLCLFLLSDTAISANETWPEVLYNPAPSEGDQNLPLPCGGTLTLRKIVTNEVYDADNPQSALSDREITIGNNNSQNRRYMENTRAEHIAGPIATGPGERFYYMGKYEITTAQYQAVMGKGADCPDLTALEAELPQNNLSWYEAVEFTRRLNQWIYSEENSLAALSALEIANAYVRLPTEVEWEFAARGGGRVGSAEHANLTFPMDAPLAQYAWYNDSQSAAGRLQPIGALRPNPVDIHDIYGNVGELTLEPFRMTRGPRLHGQVGGYVVRGGSFLSSSSNVNSAHRDELPYFSQEASGEHRTRANGMRVVVGTSAINQTDIGALEAAALSLGSQGPQSLAPNAQDRLAAVAQQTESAELRQEIERLSTELDNEFVRRDELEAKHLKAILEAASLLHRELTVSAFSIKNLFESYRLGVELGDTEEQLQSDREWIERELAHFDLYARIYTNTVQKLASNDISKIGRLAEELAAEWRAQGDTDGHGTLTSTVEQVRAYAGGQVTDTREIIRNVIGGDLPRN